MKKLDLIPMAARHINQGDVLFSLRLRKLCTVTYIVPEDAQGVMIDLKTEHHIFKRVSVSFEGVHSEDYEVDETVILAVDVLGLGVLG